MTAQQDTDLAAVREAVAARTAERELSLARSWGTVVAQRAGVEQPPRRRATRVLVPVTAAAAVATLALGTVTLLGPQWDGLGFLAADRTPSDTESYEPNLDPPSVRAVAALIKLAAAAERGEPVSFEDGQLVYLRSEGWSSVTTVADDETTMRVVVTADRESWYDPDGPWLLKSGDQTRPEPRGAGSGGARRSPGPYAPTPEWLAGLPTDPDRLRAELRRILHDDHTWSTDHAVWTAMAELYSTTEILIPPDLRAALLRAFTGLRGLTAMEVDIEGRQLVGIRHLERDTGYGILFDPQTGRAVGHRSVTLHANARLVLPTVSPTVNRVVVTEQGITSQSLWTQAVVDEVGDTG